jgi:hypothetical protein
MKSIAKPGSFGCSRSATGERFTKNWLTECVKPDGVSEAAYGNQTRLVGSVTGGFTCQTDSKVSQGKHSRCRGLIIPLEISRRQVKLQGLW